MTPAPKDSRNGTGNPTNNKSYSTNYSLLMQVKHNFISKKDQLSKLHSALDPKQTECGVYKKCEPLALNGSSKPSKKA